MAIFARRVSLPCLYEKQWGQSFGVLGIPAAGLLHVLAYCVIAGELKEYRQRTQEIRDYIQFAVHDTSRSSLRQTVVAQYVLAPVPEQLLHEYGEQPFSASQRRPRGA